MEVRKPAVAGMFYPDNESKLREQLKLLFDITSEVEKFENVFGIVVPHAGYIYSGRTAAFAYNTIANKDIDNVIIISPSHREYFPGISIYEGDAYQTALGEVQINYEIREKLAADSKSIFKGLQGHRAEHAVEVHVPFLQYLLNDFTIVPVVMGDQSKLFVDELANKMAEVVDEKTLIVASSDMSHFYSKEKANEMDSIVENRIESFDYEKLLNDLENKVCEACGGGPIVAMMKAAKLKGKEKSKVVHRSDSGDTSGDNSEVVGYLSAVIYG